MTVTLRKPAETDFTVLASLRNDPTIQKQLMIEAKTYSNHQVREWIERRSSDPLGYFRVIDFEGPTGFIQLTQIDKDLGSADMGICLARGRRGKGISTEAMKLLEREAREDHSCRQLTLRVLRTNHRAIAFYRKIDFETTETKRRHHFDGRTWRDVVFMRKWLS